MTTSLDELKQALASARSEVAKVIIGQQDVIDRSLITIFTGQHALIEGVPGVAAYEATMSGLFMFGDVPSVGDRLPLLVDSQNPQRFESDDSTSISADAGNDQSSNDNSGTIADGLGKLAGLRAQGALTDAEFSAAKAKLLADGNG